MNGPGSEKILQELRTELVAELEEAQGQLRNLQERLVSVDSRLSDAIKVLADEKEPLDIAGLQRLLSSILVVRGSFTERSGLIERAIEHVRVYQRVLQSFSRKADVTEVVSAFGVATKVYSCDITILEACAKTSGVELLFVDGQDIQSLRADQKGLRSGYIECIFRVPAASYEEAWDIINQTVLPEASRLLQEILQESRLLRLSLEQEQRELAQKDHQHDQGSEQES